MTRRRMIDPELWIDEKVAQMSLGARLLFIGSWNFADDNGNFRYSAARLKAQIFPHDTDITNDTVEGYIKEIIELGPYAEYQLDGHRYISIVHFLDYQRINRPSPTKIPKPVDISPSTQRLLSEDSVSTHGALTAQAKLSKAKLREVKLSEEQAKQSKEQSDDSAAALPSAIKSAYESAFGMFTPITYREVQGDYERYSEDWVLDAFEEAAPHKPKGYGYIHTILERWGIEGRGAKGEQDDSSEDPGEYRRRYGHLLKGKGDDKTV